MQQYESDNERGLVYGYVLNGRGGARRIQRNALDIVDLQPEETLWLHWDRSVPEAQSWLRHNSGLTEFACNLLLEEATRPRLVPLPAENLLLFLRGVNLNPGAVPEDMVSLRIFADRQRVFSLRLRPLKAAAEVQEDLEAGVGPENAQELVLQLAGYMTSRVDTLIAELAEQLDNMEERIELDERNLPEHHDVLSTRRRVAGLKRYLSPQRDIYYDLARQKPVWFVSNGDAEYWSELHNSLTRNLEELDLMRERIGFIQEVEQRSASERMGRTMYLLAIITGFFLPMSFVTGLLGMNVGGIPGSDFSHGFLIACGAILFIALFQWWLFRRLRWL
ncbi:zinc transporter [Pseudomonas duriflava]|uniref:Zinc transporter n=1 Tax=Pseudomonas duriflava TaxID=459528 RepID=A0A562Q9U1_9PSED|nr:zinc transporter ZntB [Pseudomonas duriflava]TWI53483.1 zinc transporter [Pseudomonas duriflava]